MLDLTHFDAKIAFGTTFATIPLSVTKQRQKGGEYIVKVHNVIGSSGPHYRKISMKEWLEATGRKANPTCQALNCSQIATDASHVTKVGSNDGKWYICPFCHEHNESTSDIELKSGWENMLLPLSGM